MREYPVSELYKGLNAQIGTMTGTSWFDLLLVSGRGSMHFYHVVFFYLGGSIVFADRIMAWISQRIEKPIPLWLLLLSEAVYIAMTIALTSHLQAIGLSVSWCEPGAFVGFWVVFRSVYLLVCKLSDLG